MQRKATQKNLIQFFAVEYDQIIFVDWESSPEKQTKQPDKTSKGSDVKIILFLLSTLPAWWRYYICCIYTKPNYCENFQTSRNFR